MGVFLGVFGVELSLLGVLLGVPSPFHSGVHLVGLSVLILGGLPLPLGDVGSEEGNGGGSGVVGIIPLVGLL